MTAIAGPPSVTVPPQEALTAPQGPGRGAMQRSETARPRPESGRRIFRTAGPVVLVGAIFVFAIPRFASYRSVWDSMGAMAWPQVLLVAAAAAASMVSTWVMICAVLPSIRLREAAVVNLGSNAVANTLPAGGALAMGVSWAMLSSWASAPPTTCCTPWCRESGTSCTSPGQPIPQPDNVNACRSPAGRLAKCEPR